MNKQQRKQHFGLDISTLPIGTYESATPKGTPIQMRITRPSRGAFEGWTFARATIGDKPEEKVATQHPTQMACVWSEFAERGKAGTDKAPNGYRTLTTLLEDLYVHEDSLEDSHECPEYSICQRCYA